MLDLHNKAHFGYSINIPRFNSLIIIVLCGRWYCCEIQIETVGVRNRTLGAPLRPCLGQGISKFSAKGLPLIDSRHISMSNGNTGLDREDLRAVKEGKPNALKRIYLTYQAPFISWAGVRFSCGKEEAKDVFQELMVIFYENVQEGKLEELRGSLRNYLFGIGKFLLLQRFRQAKRWEGLPEEKEEVENWAPDGSEQLELSERQSVLKQVLQQLGSPCKDILSLYYYHRYSTESIMDQLAYKNTDVVKSQKARCLRRLKQTFRHQLEQDILES